MIKKIKIELGQFVSNTKFMNNSWAIHGHLCKRKKHELPKIDHKLFTNCSLTI